MLALSMFASFAAPAEAQSTGDRCDQCGVVQSIQMTTEKAQWTPLGAATPGAITQSGQMVGGVTQFQIGPEGKNQGLVLLGAAGGAAYAKRPNAYEKPRWDVTVKMDIGSTRVVSQSYEPLLREGDRVRIMGTQVELVNF
jgi:outer membrane lipoprotein SlyB